MIEKYLSEHDFHIIPFLWLREGEHDKIREEIDHLDRSGCRAFCVEARPYEAFCQEPWFFDMDLILDEAKARGMSVFVLDDCTFPTGYANGLIRKKYPHLRARFLREFHMDAAGPKKYGKIITKKEQEETLLAAVAYRHIDNRYVGEGIVLTDFVKNGILHWDIPEGNYTVLFLYETRDGAEKPFYIDMLNPESVDCLIEGCYEPHHERYRDEFGKTFAGFFSDEPRFANGMSYPYMSRATEVGSPGMALPYSGEVFRLLFSRLGQRAERLLGGLWFDIPDCSLIRREYMDIITEKFKENFSLKISAWCKERNVLHIGHVIEDMGTHCMTSNGAGHFFRSTSGFSMGGIDIVLLCLLPFQERFHAAYTRDTVTDSEFYRYTLAKLGSSSAHIQPEKNGKALCEIFGAYGYGENLALMKWTADHMLVRGIRYFVPHAYSMRYPDGDCPPHFSRGNPISRHMPVLYRYMTTMGRLLNDSCHIAPVAALYHAELRWSGKSMPVDRIATVLTKHQIDFDILPYDSLFACTASEEGLTVHQETYRCLVVPYAATYPDDISHTLQKLQKQGLTVIFADENGDNILPEVSRYADVRVTPACPDLVYYKCRKQGRIMYMFFNEGISAIRAQLSLPEQGRYLRADVLKNSSVWEESKGTVPLSLHSYESCVFIFDEEDSPVKSGTPEFQYEIYPEEEFTVSLCKKEDYPDFRFFRKADYFFDITAYDQKPDFNGYIRYELEVQIQKEEGYFCIDFGVAEDSLEIYVNDSYAGTIICPPYTLDLSCFLKTGRNHITVILATTPVFEQRDTLSQFLTLGASGLTSPPVIKYYQ